VADAVARDATTKGAVVAGVLSLDFKSVLIWCIFARWQQHLDRTQGNKLWDVKLVVLPWRYYPSICHDKVVVTHLSIGNTHLIHSHLLSINQPPLCTPSNAQLFVRHILLDCPRQTIRYQRFHLPSTIIDMLGDNLDILTWVLVFLCAIDIFWLLWHPEGYAPLKFTNYLVMVSSSSGMCSLNCEGGCLMWANFG
jgi:hypothetical protein